MIATVINAVSVVIGSLIGLLFRKKISNEIKSAVFTAVGLITIVIGVKMSIKTDNFLFFALSISIGAVIGELLAIENHVLNLGKLIEKLFVKGNDDTFAKGFLSASVLFCAGAMTILGSFEAGALRNYDILLTKSVMDGFMAILLTTALGPGVAFSALFILFYQGLLTVFSSFLYPYINDAILAGVSGVGGVMIIMIGFNLLDIKKTRPLNYLPALVFIVFLIEMENIFPFLSNF